MSFPPGHVDRAGRIYFRCHNCGDSSNPNHCHAFMDTMGGTFCWRCREGSNLSIEQILDIMLGNTTAQEIVEEHWFGIPNLVETKLGRHTLLDKWQEEGSDYITFIMYDGVGNPIGEHRRQNRGKGYSLGRSGISWPNAEHNQLLSNPAEPLICVEGPFDVIRDNFVCMFGSITYSKLKFLRLHDIWLWPDPDILDTDQKRRKFVAMCHHANNNLCNVQGIIFSEADPDESKIQAYIPFNDLPLWLEKGSKQWRK